MLYTNRNVHQVERVSGSKVTYQVIAELFTKRGCSSIPQGTLLIPNSDNTGGKKLLNIFLGGLSAAPRHTALTLRAQIELISIYSTQSSTMLLAIWSHFEALSSSWSPRAAFFFVLSSFQMEQSYFTAVKLIYTIGYSISLVLLAVAVLILLLFRSVRSLSFACY